VREASIIAEGRRIYIVGRYNDAGGIEARIALLANEPFRSLALAIRLVYQQKEPAQFFGICSVVDRDGGAGIKARVAAVRDAYRAALRNPAGAIVVVDGAGNKNIFTAQHILEHWMYGVAFHQDLDRQDSVRLLAAAGDSFALSVQSTALLLAGRILDLDDVIADHLGEPRLDRIPEPPPAAGV